jgi:GH35 family endo-1,4-beta-xylanase
MQHIIRRAMVGIVAIAIFFFQQKALAAAAQDENRNCDARQSESSSEQIAGLMGAWRAYWQAKRPSLNASIERLRKRDYEFTLTNACGRPMANVSVEVRQISSDFSWGCAALSLGQLGAKNKDYEARLSEFFNLLTTTFCPGVMTPKKGKWRFEESKEDDIWRRPPPDRVLAFARKHGMRFKGQPLMCDRWHPSWAKRQTKAEAEAFYTDWFKRVAERYGKSAFMFDVVNEAFDTKKRTPDFPLYCGDEELPFVDWAFAEAQKVFPPECKLDINMGVGATEWKIHGKRYYNLCKRIVDSGIRLDSIGFQFHLFSNKQLRDFIALKKWHPDMLSEYYRKMGSLNRPLFINEITIPSTLLPGAAGQAIQAEVADDLYRFWFATSEINGVTWWNLMDGAAWKNEDKVKGALLDDFAREKPVYRALRNLIAREWKTVFRTRTDENGTIRFRGFVGNYAVSFMNSANNAIESRIFKNVRRQD